MSADLAKRFFGMTNVTNNHHDRTVYSIYRFSWIRFQKVRSGRLRSILHGRPTKRNGSVPRVQGWKPAGVPRYSAESSVLAISTFVSDPMMRDGKGHVVQLIYQRCQRYTTMWGEGGGENEGKETRGCDADHRRLGHQFERLNPRLEVRLSLSVLLVDLIISESDSGRHKTPRNKPPWSKFTLLISKREDKQSFNHYSSTL